MFDNNAASGQEAKPERMINQSMVSGGTSSTINLIADDNTAVSSASAIEQKLDSCIIFYRTREA